MSRNHCHHCMTVKYVIIAILVIMLGASLYGCTKDVTPPAEAPAIFHPASLAPVQLDHLNWTVLTKKRQDLLKEDSVYVALTWEEYLKLSQNMVEITNLIKSQGNVICYYRADLKESRCAPRVAK